MVEQVVYEIEGWGVGELVFDDRLVAWHELPSNRREADGSTRQGIVHDALDDDRVARGVLLRAGGGGPEEGERE